MKKLFSYLITYCLTFLILSVLVIQIIYIVQIRQKFGITLDFSLLWFKGTNELISYILGLSLIPLILIMFNSFSSSHKKNEKNYNNLMTERECRKDLLKVSFDHHFYNTASDNMMISLSKLTKPINRTIRTMSRTNSTARFLCNHNILLPEISEWKIGKETVYKRSGFPIITKHNTIWLDPSDSHNMVIGTTNSGKTFSVLFEQIELARMAGESAIIVDLKGELSKATYSKFKRDGYNCYCIDFIEPSRSSSWNPLELGKQEYYKEKNRLDQYKQDTEEKIRKLKKAHYQKFGKSVPFIYNEYNENGDPILDEYGGVIAYPNYSKAEEYFADVCNVIFAPDDPKSSHWFNSASELANGLIFFLAENGEPEFVNLEAVKKLCDLGDTAIAKKKTYLQAAVELLRTPDDISASKLVGYTEIAEETRKSVKSVFSSRLGKIITNQDVKNMLASNDIDLAEIGEKKTVIFLKVHDEKSVYYPLVNLFISQIYECLIANARNNKDLKLTVPINILWDEFGSSPKFEPIMNLLSAGRSRGIRVTLVVQGYDQLESKYGKDGARSIKNNIMNKVYLLSGDESTLKEFSTLAGKKLVKRKGKWEEEPIFSIERLSRFSLGEALFIRQRKNPFYTKLLPYNRYDFFTSEKTEFEVRGRKTAKWLNIIDLVNSHLPRKMAISKNNEN